MAECFTSILGPVFLGIAILYVQVNSEGQVDHRVNSKHHSSLCKQDSLQATIARLTRGNSKLDVPTLDPLSLKGYDYDINEYLITLNVAFNEGNLKGLKQCQVVSFRFTDNKMDLSLLCSVVMDGAYRLYFREFGIKFPVPGGDGRANVILRDLRINASVVLDTKVKDGESYLHIKDIKTKHEFLGVITYNITNFGDNSVENYHALLKDINQNWRMAADVLVNPILQKVINVVIDNVKKILTALPLNQLENCN